MSPSFFIPFSSLNQDVNYTHPTRANDATVIGDYDDVIPTAANAAVPRRSLSSITTPALTGKCRGFSAARDKQARDIVLAGDSTHLYRAFSTLTGTFTFSAIHSLSITMSTCATWEFAHFEESPTSTSNFATNGSTPVLRSQFRHSVTMSFVALSSPSVRARHIGVISRFLVLGNTSEGTSATGSYAPSRVWWSAFGTPTDFSPSAATQSDWEDLASGGAVQKITSGTEYGLVFQERQVQVMRYVGRDVIFDFSPINYAPGTPIPNSVIAYNGVVYYISREGVIALNGLDIQRIGNNKIDRHFWETVDQSRFHDITSGVDHANKIIWWAYPTDTAGYSKRMLGYKSDDGRWTRWFQDTEAVGTIRQGLPGEMFVAFDTDHKLKSWTSNAFVNGVFQTKRLQPDPGKRWQCNGITLYMSGIGTLTTGTVTARVFDSLHPSAAPSSTTAVTLRANETYFPLRVAGKYIDFTLTLNPGSSTETRYIGMELDYVVLGDR